MFKRIEIVYWVNSFARQCLTYFRHEFQNAWFDEVNLNASHTFSHNIFCKWRNHANSRAITNEGIACSFGFWVYCDRSECCIITARHKFSKICSISYCNLCVATSPKFFLAPISMWVCVWPFPTFEEQLYERASFTSLVMTLGAKIDL